MRFLLDENVDIRLATFLRSLDHDVATLVHDFATRLEDEEVLALARRERRILITNDVDFGDLVVRRRLPHAGLILFRLSSVEYHVKQDRLAHVLAHYAANLHQFLIVSDRSVRIRAT